MSEYTFTDFTPGCYVVNKKNSKWGVGQIQSCIKNLATVNFENVGKKVIDIKVINLEIIDMK